MSYKGLRKKVKTYLIEKRLVDKKRQKREKKK